MKQKHSLFLFVSAILMAALPTTLIAQTVEPSDADQDETTIVSGGVSGIASDRGNGNGLLFDMKIDAGTKQFQGDTGASLMMKGSIGKQNDRMIGGLSIYGPNYYKKAGFIYGIDAIQSSYNVNKIAAPMMGFVAHSENQKFFMSLTSNPFGVIQMRKDDYKLAKQGAPFSAINLNLSQSFGDKNQITLFGYGSIAAVHPYATAKSEKVSNSIIMSTKDEDDASAMIGTTTAPSQTTSQYVTTHQEMEPDPFFPNTYHPVTYYDVNKRVTTLTDPARGINGLYWTAGGGVKVKLGQRASLKTEVVAEQYSYKGSEFGFYDNSSKNYAGKKIDVSGKATLSINIIK